MRLVAVAVVKNEADIIEAFVRHTLAWVDHLLVFDHDSTDGTRELLLTLRDEGLPIRLFTDDVLGNLQAERTNHLVRLAATTLGAEWILPLDADEFLTGPDRPALEAALATSPAGQPRSLPLLNYLFTDADPADETNPVRRLKYCQPSSAPTRKVMIPAALATDAAVIATMGNHALERGGQRVPDLPLGEEFYLAHLPMRSPEHQLLRIVLPQLQKFSQGRAHLEIGTHNRLGFQLLAEEPDLFFAVTRRPASSLQLRPIPYRGAPLRHSTGYHGWQRAARALLPYLEKLAMSHGQLVDQLGAAETARTNPVIRELDATVGTGGGVASHGFGGFTDANGLGPSEGPVPEAFLPVFHWGYAPATTLTIEAPSAQGAKLITDLLSYSRDQTVTVALNGVTLHQQTLARINQKERIVVALPLRAGSNELAISYSQNLVTDYDPRKLAVIFLSLRVQPPGLSA